MSSEIRSPIIPFALDLPRQYEHLKRIEWPKDLPGPNHWKLDPNLSDLSKELKEMAGRVSDFAIRFYQKVKGSPAPKVRGDTDDPDTIHALKFALDRQDELETLIKPPKEKLTELLMSWLQERKRSLVRSMEVVVIVEEGELYDDSDRWLWNAKPGEMIDEQVEHLRLMFRCVMDRVDAIQVEKRNWKGITERYMAKTVVIEQGRLCAMPVEQKNPFWRIEDSIMGSLTSKAREAALALYYQGRAFNGAWAKMLVTDEDEIPTSIVIERTMNLVLQNIDLVWIERPKGWSKEEEERLSDWLIERKSAAGKCRLCWTERHISPDLYGQTIQIDTKGMIFVMKKGKFEPWGLKVLA